MNKVLLILLTIAYVPAWSMDESVLPPKASLEMHNRLDPRILAPGLTLSLRGARTASTLYKLKLADGTTIKNFDGSASIGNLVEILEDPTFEWGSYGTFTQSNRHGYFYQTYATLCEPDGTLLYEGELNLCVGHITHPRPTIWATLQSSPRVNFPEPAMLPVPESDNLRRILQPTVALDVSHLLRRFGPVVFTLTKLPRRTYPWTYHGTVDGNKFNPALGVEVSYPHVNTQFNWEAHGNFEIGKYVTWLTLARPKHESEPFFSDNVSAAFECTSYDQVADKGPQQHPQHTIRFVIGEGISIHGRPLCQ